MGSENRVGEVLASKYRLEALLGSGGMGHVYRAVNEHIGRLVAIKVLRAEHAQNAAVVERFLREARAANLVRHPNVVDVLDIGKEDGGAPFIVQELLEGEDLAHLVARRGGKLSLDEAVTLLSPVVDAVAEAHARGVVHRDIKPENVFLAKSARGPVPKLLDFGISKIRAPDLRATEVGVMMGTPAYMAPEQVQGARDADFRSDVWALGVMIFEILAGRLPFDAQDAPALYVAIATKDAPTLLEVRAEVTPDISRVVERCLRRRPDERYPSAAELARDLRHAMGGEDLEPTGKRSIPPGIRIPDLGGPGAAHAPTLVPDLVPHGPVPVIVSSSRAEAATVKPVRASERGPENPLPEAPSLPPPAAPRPVPPREPREPPSSPATPAGPPSSASAGRGEAGPRSDPRSRLTAEASLSGVGLAPGPPSAPRAKSREAWGAQGSAPLSSARDVADMSPVVGFAVVVLIAILGTGLLMRLVHRPEGWPIAQFAFAPAHEIALVMHGALALIATAIGATYCRRGVRHWRGELGGGPPNAIVNAVVAAGAFFCAIELVSAVY